MRLHNRRPAVSGSFIFTFFRRRASILRIDHAVLVVAGEVGAEHAHLHRVALHAEVTVLPEGLVPRVADQPVVDAVLGAGAHDGDGVVLVRDGAGAVGDDAARVALDARGVIFKFLQATDHRQSGSGR